MLEGILQTIAVAVLPLYAAIAWVILRDYRQTRNIGFLIIGCGLVLWPLLNRAVLSIAMYFEPGNLWIRLVLDRTSNVVEAGLILTGLIAIERSMSSSRIAG